MGLKTKGETADEIHSIVRALKSSTTVLPETFTDAMCNLYGTGGDDLIASTFRLLFAFILAAGGIRIAKAGNRSISSSGSLASLKYGIQRYHRNPILRKEALDEVSLAFIFAQTMHPAMRFISPARQALGIPTIMNLVVLANPLDLETQLHLGLYRVGATRSDPLMLFQQLGRKRAVII